ncbi:CPBP family intramembrane glutamic endopeptidase [Pandoraea sputorum]|uniref:CPBP family intramembrane glutamic endopeptidase n=1 Tax=Pandoraea sputorum TaxID=93222 RepID=UPI001242B445|nr:CPBP family intramembrane glutamic endopeptidase [Pandoraea sputorum]VVE55666.1 CAAX protease [Pandoraea sputorum]
MLTVPWIAIFAAALVVWVPAFRWGSLALLGIGYGAALATGQIDVWAAIPIMALGLAAYAVSSRRKPYLPRIGHTLFIVLAAALSMHWFAGFHNPRVIGPERFTADAVPFTMYLNFDKPLVGFWLVLVLPWVRPPQQWRVSLKAGLGGMLMSSALCLLIAVLLGLVRWAPKWPAASGLWLLNNLLLVTLTEEALFRGYLQGGLRRLLGAHPYADMIALGIAAGLFGLAHVAGGWPWMVLGSAAGIGYGLAYRFGGLQAAVLAHFGLNVAHFFLLTYPMLQPIGPP